MQALAKDYLLGSQRPDGSWGSGDPFVCSRALYALHDDMPEDTLLRGLKYLEGCQEPDGHFSPKTKVYSDASNTAYTLIVLNKFDYGKASLPVTRGIMWLLEDQNEDGSWGPNTHKKAFTTTFCLRALHTFYLSGINRFARGLDFSLEYLKGLSFEEEPVSHVYAPVLNMKRIGYLDDVIKDKFIEYAWMATRDSIGDGRVADAASLLGALKALEEPDISSVIEEWIPAAQNDDGGFGKVYGDPSEPGPTALVILALNDRL
jgi:prenyltransferase beta subunit